ncbi:MAG: GNAT family N-acetyltransferase [Candidatus Baltobacteraceae bacterium]
MNIRTFEKADAEFIVACFRMPHAAAFLRVPQAERVRAAVDDADIAGFILEDAGTPVGHLLLRNLGRNWNIAEIAQLVVTRPRKGYGRVAIEFAMHHIFEKRNAHRCYLDVVAHNTAACKLYERCGFLREALFRDGFPADDGTFCDLAGYGMLASDYFARSHAQRRNDE